MSIPDLNITEPIIHHGRIAMPYRHSAGIAGSQFFHGLQEGKILGIQCLKCRKTYVPPKIVCPECFELMDEWVTLGGTGTVLTFTKIYYSSPVHPVEPPFILGCIHLDGADTALLHLIGEVEDHDLKPGLRVQAVFNDKPEGNILDVKYFKAFNDR